MSNEEYEIFRPKDVPPEGAHIPLWALSVIRTKDGVLWASHALTPYVELGAFLCACNDGVAIFTDDDGHMYFPLSWLEQEFPDCREIAAMMRRRIEG